MCEALIVHGQLQQVGPEGLERPAFRSRVRCPAPLDLLSAVWASISLGFRIPRSAVWASVSLALQAVHSAREAILLAQLAIPHHQPRPHGAAPDAAPTRGATPVRAYPAPGRTPQQDNRTTEPIFSPKQPHTTQHRAPELHLGAAPRGARRRSSQRARGGVWRPCGGRVEA